MPNANQHLPAQIIFAGRRCSERRYFLAPRPETEQICGYAYCLAAVQHGMVAHGEMTMMNHRHGCQTDLFGKRSKFHERYHGLVGRYVNGSLGRSGHFWDNRAPSATVILPDDPADEASDDRSFFPSEFTRYAHEHDLDPADIALLYTWLNPVVANLVDRVADYPGFKIVPDDWATGLRYSRPPNFPQIYPADASLMPRPPARWDGRPVEEAIQFYNDHIAALEDIYREKRDAAGRGTLGEKGCRGVAPFDRPDTIKKRSPAPRFAGGKSRVNRANKAYCTWLRRYTKQRRRLANGHRNVVFPAGTVQLRRIAGVRCRKVPLPDENPHL